MRTEERTGQQRRQDDWMVGQYLRINEPDKYASFLAKAIEASVKRFAEGFGVSIGNAAINRSSSNQE